MTRSDLRATAKQLAIREKQVTDLQSRLAAAEEALEKAYGLLPAKDSAYYLLSPEVRATVVAVERVREERAKLAQGKER